MQWEVCGADRTTGVEKKLVIDADDEASATRRGNRRGIMVESVRPLDADDSVVGGVVTRQATQVVEYRSPSVRTAPPPPQPVQIPVPVSTPKGMNLFEWIGVGASCFGVLLLCIGGKQAGNPDNPSAGGTLLAAGIILLLVGLLVFAVGRMVGHR